MEIWRPGASALTDFYRGCTHIFGSDDCLRHSLDKMERPGAPTRRHLPHGGSQTNPYRNSSFHRYLVL